MYDLEHVEKWLRAYTKQTESIQVHAHCIELMPILHPLETKHTHDFLMGFHNRLMHQEIADNTNILFAVNQLEDKTEREAITKRFIQGLPADECARSLGITQKQLEKILLKALKTIQKNVDVVRLIPRHITEYR